MPPLDPVLLLLKRRDGLTTQAVASALGITRQAAAVRLAALQAAGRIAAISERGKVGRPRQCWSLVDANAGFPDAHAELSVELISAVRETFGEAGLDRIISVRETQTTAAYTAAMEGAASLRERVARLAEVRSREGYMAEWSEADGDFLLVENHCPICAAALICQGFCRSELDIFRRVLGPAARVERTDHIVTGARRCAYLITSAD